MCAHICACPKCGCVCIFWIPDALLVRTLLPLQKQYRPLVWRNTHPYILVDRHEDVTDPNVVEQDLYGYVRGTHLKPNMMVHMIGVGDFGLASISVWPDPLALPDLESEARKVRHDSWFRVDARVLGRTCSCYHCP
jgi:AARP2CN (NUC121) domain